MAQENCNFCNRNHFWGYNRGKRRGGIHRAEDDKTFRNYLQI